MESSHNGGALWCGSGWRASARQGGRFQLCEKGGFFTSPRTRGEGEAAAHKAPTLRIALRASDSPISTKAEVTSGPPTRMRVGVFILFHS